MTPSSRIRSPIRSMYCYVNTLPLGRAYLESLGTPHDDARNDPKDGDRNTVRSGKVCQTAVVPALGHDYIPASSVHAPSKSRSMRNARVEESVLEVKRHKIAETDQACAQDRRSSEPPHWKDRFRGYFGFVQQKDRYEEGTNDDHPSLTESARASHLVGIIIYAPYWGFPNLGVTLVLDPVGEG